MLRTQSHTFSHSVTVMLRGFPLWRCTCWTQNPGQIGLRQPRCVALNVTLRQWTPSVPEGVDTAACMNQASNYFRSLTTHIEAIGSSESREIWSGCNKADGAQNPVAISAQIPEEPTITM